MVTALETRGGHPWAGPPGLEGLPRPSEEDPDARDAGLISGSGIPYGEGNGSPLQYSCLENPMDRGAWQAVVHGVAESSAGDTGDLDSIPGSGRSSGGGHGSPLQYSCLENPMDRGAWQATVQGVTKSRTRLSNIDNFLLKC